MKQSCSQIKVCFVALETPLATTEWRVGLWTLPLLEESKIP